MISYLQSLAVSCFLVVTGAAVAEAHNHRQHRSHSSSHSYHLAADTTASFYGARQSGRRMTNGRRFKPMAMTAASRTLPLGATVRVTNLANHLNALVLVTDRVGRHGHALDLSLGAARHLGMQKQGLARVRIERVS